MKEEIYLGRNMIITIVEATERFKLNGSDNHQFKFDDKNYPFKSLTIAKNTSLTDLMRALERHIDQSAVVATKQDIISRLV